MATLVVVPEADIDLEAQEFLHHASDEVVACRGQRHSWPILKPGAIPKGIKADPAPGGCFQLTFTCSVCTTTRTLTTLPKGVYDKSAQYVYKHPQGYKAPKGSGLTPRDFFGEALRRSLEDLLVQTRPVERPRRRRAATKGASA
jgi:hypothetical protein